MSEGVQVWPEFKELQVVREEMQVTSVLNCPPVLSRSPGPENLVHESWSRSPGPENLVHESWSRTTQQVTLSVSDVRF